MVYINRRVWLKGTGVSLNSFSACFLEIYIESFNMNQKGFSTWPFQRMSEKNPSLGRAEPSGSPTAFVWGCEALSRQGPWGWTPACYTNKVLFTFLSAVEKEQGLVYVWSGSQTNIEIYIQVIWRNKHLAAQPKAIHSGMSAPCVSAVGQSTGSALHSLDFTAVPLWGWMCGCEQWVAPALFSIFLHNCRNFKKVVTKVWIFSSSIINFFFLFFSSSITLVFFLVLHWFPGSFLLHQRDAQVHLQMCHSTRENAAFQKFCMKHGEEI